MLSAAAAVSLGELDLSGLDLVGLDLDELAELSCEEREGGTAASGGVDPSQLQQQPQP